MTRTWILALAVLASCGRDTLSPAQRQEVRAMIAEDRAEQARKADEERNRLAEEQVRAQLDRVAGRYHLTAGEKKNLNDVTQEYAAKLRELSDRFSGPAKAADFDAFDSTIRELNTWRNDELASRFEEHVAVELIHDPLWIAVAGPSLPAPR